MENGLDTSEQQMDPQPEGAEGFAVSVEPEIYSDDDPSLPENQPDPTFDVEADREAGVDVDHPLYQKMLAMHESTQDDGQQDGQDQLDAMTAELRAKQLFETEQQQSAEPSLEYNINWEGFNPTRLSEEDPLFEHADTIGRMIEDRVGYVMKQVNAQSSEMARQQQLAQTRDYLTQVVDAVGEQGGPAKKSQALKLLADYKDIAIRNPKQWAEFAVSSLGIQPNASQKASRPAGAPDARKTAQQLRGRSAKPQQTRTTAKPVQQKFEKTQDAVAFALDAQLGRRR